MLLNLREKVLVVLRLILLEGRVLFYSKSAAAASEAGEGFLAVTALAMEDQVRDSSQMKPPLVEEGTGVSSRSDPVTPSSLETPPDLRPDPWERL